VLQMCVDKLPKNIGRIFMMREWLELETDEICKELGISASNCWVMLYRARMRLKECLELNWFNEKISCTMISSAVARCASPRRRVARPGAAVLGTRRAAGPFVNVRQLHALQKADEFPTRCDEAPRSDRLNRAAFGVAPELRQSPPRM